MAVETTLVATVVVVVISLVQLLSSHAAQINLKVSPERAFLVANRWSVNFTCTMRSSSINTSQTNSSNLAFYLYVPESEKKSQLPDSCTRQVDATRLELKQCPPVDEHRGRVYISCQLKHDPAIKSVESYVDVKDQHPPPEILTAEAEVYNWDYMTLKVNTKEDKERMFWMTYTAWVAKHSDQSMHQECSTEMISDSLLIVTAVDPFGITFPDDELMIKVNGTVKTKRLVLETVESNEVRLNLNQYVKPAKVSNIKVLQNDSSLTLSFYPPKLNRNITYNIVIKCEKAVNNITVNVTREIQSDHCNNTQHSINTRNWRDCSIYKEFTDLPPYSNCTSSVRAISVSGGKWSEWETRNFETLEGVPLRNPEVCSSCFSLNEGVSDSMSNVIVYFTPLSDDEAQGKVVLYRIRILDNSGSNESVKYLNNTENSHFSFVLKNLSNRFDYEIGIEAKTAKGYSISHNISNNIRISLSDIRSLSNFYPKHFTVTLLTCMADYATVRTSWELGDDDCNSEKKIFLVWCEGNAKTKTCKDVLKWKTVSSELRSDVIIFSGDEFIFGIGIECDGKSSGILWNSCSLNIGKCPTDSKIESCRGVSRPSRLIRPDVQRFDAVVGSYGTDFRLQTLITIIPVGTCTFVFCFLFVAVIVFRKSRNRLTSESDSRKVSVIFPPPIQISIAKNISSGGYKIEDFFGVPFMDRAKPDVFEVNDVCSFSGKDLSCDLNHSFPDDNAFGVEVSTLSPRSDSAVLVLMDSILPPIIDCRVVAKSQSNSLPPVDDFHHSRPTHDGQTTNNHHSSDFNRNEVPFASAGDFITQSRVQWSGVSQGVQSECSETTIACENEPGTPRLDGSGYAFCNGNVPVVILPVPTGQAKPIEYEDE